MDERESRTGIHLALDIWARRRWLGAAIFLGTFAPALSFIASLPDIYKASTTVRLVLTLLSSIGVTVSVAETAP